MFRLFFNIVLCLCSNLLTDVLTSDDMIHGDLPVHDCHDVLQDGLNETNNVYDSNNNPSSPVNNSISGYKIVSFDDIKHFLQSQQFPHYIRGHRGQKSNFRRLVSKYCLLDGHLMYKHKQCRKDIAGIYVFITIYIIDIIHKLHDKVMHIYSILFLVEISSLQ